uniref:Variant erythrocyte surface antigen-1, beta subunit n=1 Tax=Babesia bovis TaxID=5865 RepID=A7AWV4_BABBO|eukprot:XP_001609100.1 variant erythrocyte surface antigen-1, beta subunit [Babesia bovis T2Bo]
MAAQAWTPYNSLTQAPTNLKEAIDWVLRVTGRDGKSNKAAQPPPSTSNGPHCLCYLAKAVKDLLYDARSPEYPGPSTGRNWNDILLDQEQSIVKPVLTDLGLLSDSTSAASTTTTCAGGTEVIKALIDQLAQGLQKWVGWQKGKEVCCLDTETGIGGKCTCPGGGAGGCCTGSSGTCTCASANNCYKSAYNKDSALWTNIVNGTTGKYPLVVIWTNGVVGVGGSGSAGSAVTVNPVKAAQEVHLLARIFLGSVCLIWSGLSQLGFLTGGGKRWSQDGKLHEVDKGLGSFMAAMGYDLDRLNQEKGGNNNGEFVQTLLTGGKDKGVPWQEFKNGPPQDSVAEYYSSIYDNAKGAAKGKKTEEICTKYPLLVLHILASGYFRAGSAGAKGVTTPPAKPAPSDSRKPRTIREILYWLSALPYSKGYRELVERMQSKMEGILPKKEQEKGEMQLHGESQSSTTLKRDCITHYLMAACGYCPLVLIGIQGTIATSGTDPAAASGSSGSAGDADQNKCPNHSKDPTHKRCTLEEAAAQPAADQSQSTTTGKPLQAGQVCYGGYHLAVKDFGPLHGMYANGLFGFDMGGSAAQCLDQLRIYVYHCFYQLYFLRKQCKVGVVDKDVLGWKSCRYGYQVAMRDGKVTNKWQCTDNGAGQKCKCLADGAIQHTGGSPGEGSPLQSFLCDILGSLKCKETTGSSVKRYPDIEKHWTTKYENPPGHYEGAPKHCPVPMGWEKETNFKGTGKYPAHCTGRTLSLLLEYYCDPEKCHGTLVVLLRLLACITPTVPRTLGDLFGFYYYIVYIGGQSGGGGQKVYQKLESELRDVRLSMLSGGNDAVVTALEGWNKGDCSGKGGNLKCLYTCDKGAAGQCSQYLCPLSGQQYGQLSPAMAGTYLSWLVYLIGEFQGGLQSLEKAFKEIDCKDSECRTGGAASGAGGCGNGKCVKGEHGKTCDGGDGVCKCPSVVSCTGVLPVLYKYGFGYGNVSKLHTTGGTHKKCHNFLGTLESVLKGEHLKKDSNTGLHREINQLIYTTRLPWIFVLTLAWLVAVLYLAFGAIWPLDWTHMRSHCRGWFRKGSLSPWEILMVGKKKGRGILEFFGGR